MQQPAAAVAAHAEAVRLVDDEQRTLPAADVVQRPQRRHHAVGAEHRIRHDHRTVFVAGAQGGVDGVDVAVRRDHDAGPGQPAGVDQ